MKFMALTFSCLLFLSIPARADDAGLFNAMLALAEKGDSEAQYHVGMMHNNGIGTPQDRTQAFAWFQKSAASHDPLGAYKLGCYYDGQGAGIVETNRSEGLKYKLIAAQAGYSLAQHDVALLYARQGNMDEAVKWMKMAADQGDDAALYKMSRAYSDGKGVPKDLSLNADAKAVLDGMSAKMSDAEISNAQKMVADWTPRPTALTIKAKSGLAAAEEYVKKVK
jgi:uncharacterized protein